MSTQVIVHNHVAAPPQIAHVMLLDNVFTALQTGKKFAVKADGRTLRDWLKQRFGPDFEDFEIATGVRKNGEWIYRKDWDDELKDGDVYACVTLPGDISSIVIAIIALIVALVAVVMTPDPENPAENKASDPVFTLKGQTNKIRLNEPIEASYGYVRLFPSIAAPSYNRYKDGKQYQYTLYCAGQGEFDFHTFFFEDTSIDTFDGVTLEIIPPGGTTKLFATNVTTAVEVNGFEMYGPNEPDYVPWLGGYVVNPAGTTVDRLEVDVAWPSGLYTMYKSGRINTTVRVVFEYQLINNVGTPIGAWTTLVDTTQTRKTNDPVRLTLGLDVPPGRYQVRGHRVTNTNTNSSVVSTVQWEAARGVSSLVNSFGNVTVIAVEALASNSLNSNTKRGFNCYATRKLPIWDTITGWSAPTATRNPAWAFCDIFRSTYGGKAASTRLDLNTLYELAAVYEARGDTFDWTFDQSGTVWPAGQTALRPGRTVPLPQGSLVTAVRDIPRTMPSAVFNHHNTSRGTVRKQLSLHDFNAFDSLLVEYTDPVTWQPQNVLCVLPGYAGVNPDNLKMIGMTDRDKAYREGMLIEAKRKRCRKTVVFQTGVEGFLPTYMDLCDFTHPVLRVGRGGIVMGYNSTTKVMILSERVTFAPGQTHQIQLRGSDGGANGDPITVTAGDSPHKVVLAHNPDTALDFSTNQMRVLYAFGVPDFLAFRGNCVSVRPSSMKDVEITLLNYDASVYEFDELFAPPLVTVTRVEDPGAPSVENVIISTRPDNPNTAIITWKPTSGATGYVLQKSVDNGAHWEDLTILPATAKSYEFTIQPGDMIVRVAARGRIRGGWFTTPIASVGIVGTPPASPELNGSLAPFTGLSFTTSWQPAAGAGGYAVQVLRTSDSHILRDVDIANSLDFTYDLTTCLADNAGVPERSLTLKITAYNTGGESDPATVRAVVNPSPVLLTSPANGSPTGLTYPLTWDAIVSLPLDFDSYRVYGSTVSGFTPDASTLKYSGATAGYSLTVPSTPYYWRVAAFDKWARSHTDAVFTTEQTIP